MKKPRKPIPAMSKKRKAEHKIYLKLRSQFLKENPTCQMPGCKRKATDIHHIIPRSLAKELVCDRRNWIALCRWSCHDWIHANPKHAIELGVLITQPGTDRIAALSKAEATRDLLKSWRPNTSWHTEKIPKTARLCHTKVDSRCAGGGGGV